MKTTTTQTITVKTSKDAESHKITVTFDWTDTPSDELQNWAQQQRVIALQAQLRKLTDESLIELTESGYNVHVIHAGSKIMTKAEAREQAKAAWAGMPEDLKAELLAKYNANV